MITRDSITSSQYTPDLSHLSPDETELHIRTEWKKCKKSFIYFVQTYVWIRDEAKKKWSPFHMWPSQRQLCKTFRTYRLVVILKARQLGITWIALAYVLWLMIFHGVGTYLLLSKGLREAKKLLFRMKGMYMRLPTWLQAKHADWNSTDGKLSTGAEVISLPSGSGDSYTASGVILDEGDLVKDQDSMYESVAPTFEDGGWCIWLSKVDKKRPDTLFKNTYIEAKETLQSSKKLGPADWFPVFLPWHARPERTQEWYDTLKAKTLRKTGSNDIMWANYPATDEEALAELQLNKRLPAIWLKAGYAQFDPLNAVRGAPDIPNLRIYLPPMPGVEYVIGADCAEGLPDGDDSAFTICRKDTGVAVAHGAGKWEPKHQYGPVLEKAARYYNDAWLNIERNNHGHSVIAWVEEHAPDLVVLHGPDDRPGWLTSGSSKTTLFDEAGSKFKSIYVDQSFGKSVTPVLYDFKVRKQLGSIGLDLKAPGKDEGRKCIDDEAMGYVLALVGCTLTPPEPKRKRTRVWVATTSREVGL